MLDLAETSIGREGWTHRRLDGTMSQQRRESALKVVYIDSLDCCALEMQIRAKRRPHTIHTVDAVEYGGGG